MTTIIKGNVLIKIIRSCGYLFCLFAVIIGLSCKKNDDIDLYFATSNKLIFDFYQQNSDSISFKGDLPWLLNFDKKKMLLFNKDNYESYATYYGFPKTNHHVQYKAIDAVFNLDFSEDDPLIDYEKILYIKLDKELYNLENMSKQEKIDILVYIAQKLYIFYLKSYNRELTDFPSVNYPITNIENQILSSIEYQILLQAYEKSKNNDAESVLELLKIFYSIRINRWRSLSSFVQTFELSQEKILGLSYYNAMQMLCYYEDILKNKSKKTNLQEFKNKDFLHGLSTEKIIDEKLTSLLDGPLISMNLMSKQKAETVGFMLASLYDFLKWNYHPETSKENFHIFLGTRLSLKGSEIDSLYKSHLESIDIDYLTELATNKKDVYEHDFNTQKKDYNLQIYFDHYTDDFYSTKENYYVSSTEKSILFPHVNRYKIKSVWLEIDINKQGFLYNLDRKSKNIQTMIQVNPQILINDKQYSLNDLEKLVYFETLTLNSNHVNLQVKAQGEVFYEDNVLTIKVIPKLRFFIEEEYWEAVDELNRTLIDKGLPIDWLESHINNDKFRIYTSVVRNFTIMPENQVARGEKDQNWYKRHFGVDAKIKKAKDFKKDHQKVLTAAEKRFGIHYELALGILALESDFGNPRFRGNFYTFPTLVSQYLLLPRRKKFAVNELVALYKFSEKTEKDVYYFIGSYAGASGYGQFIPTSLNTYFIGAKETKKEIDIFDMEDNIHSILNYLNKNGLSSSNINNKNARFKAVRAYNHSDAYANAVLYIYDELRKTR